MNNEDSLRPRNRTIKSSPSPAHKCAFARGMTMKIGRSAKSGRFTTVKQAKSKPNTHVVETVKSGKGGKK